MSKLTAALMSSAAHPSEPKLSQFTQASVKPAQRTRGWPPQQPLRSLNRRAQRNKPVAASDDSDDSNGESEPDELVPDRVVCGEFNISAMTLWRWDHDPELAALGLPPPVVIRKRKFRVRRQLEAFKQRMLRRAIEQRAEAAIARQVGAET
jgi:hypothetical protein